MSVMTYGSALGMIGVTVPQHLEDSATVPVLTGVQAQGDLLIVPIDSAPEGEFVPVPQKGVQVVFGEATGNSHYLHGDGKGVSFFRPAEKIGQSILFVKVAAGCEAFLIHTDEHGANGIGEGVYSINEKREMREEIVRVQD